MIQFANPAYLYALGLVAVPIAIHLFNFQRARKVYFTNVAFLKNVKKAAHSYNRLKHLLALLARIGFVAFLVFAFARPFIPQRDAEAMESGRYVSVYFDNSYSLQAENGDRQLFSMAVSYIDQLPALESFSRNALFQLVDNGFRGGDFFYGPEKLSDRLAELQSDAQFSNTGRTLQAVYDKQLAALTENAAGSGNHLFWVSDFQRNSVGDLSELQIDSNQYLYLIPLQPTTETNLYIDSVWLSSPFVQLQENSTLNLRVVNDGAEPLEDKAVKFFVGPKQVSGGTVSIGARTSETLTLNFSVSEPGDKKCRISVEDYPVSFDNDYFFTLKVAPVIKALHVPANVQESGYVKSVFANAEFFELLSFNPEAPDYTLFDAADLIVLEGYAEINATLQASLNRALERGASLAVFPGQRPEPESYAALTGVPCRAVDEGAPSAALAPPEERNPFFEGVFVKVSQNVSMPTARPTLAWSESGALPGTSLLRYKNDEPFLTRFERGESKVYLCASPLDEAFTNLGRHALFVPIMYKMAFGSKMKSERLAFSFDESVAEITLDSLRRDDIYILRSETVETTPSRRVSGNRLILNVPTDIPADSYDILRREGRQPVGIVSFNYGKQESKLAHYSTQELEELFGAYPNVQVFDGADPEGFLREFERRSVATPLWRYAALLALLFLLFETLVIRFWKEVV